MARVEGAIVIARAVHEVFDYVADQRNEPQYNPRMVRAEKITEGPVGKGTKFRSAVASMGRTAEMQIECTSYDRPTRFASTTTMSQADISYVLRFEPAGAGTRMSWSGQVRPKGALRLLGPLITWLGGRQERRIWTSMKERLEADAAEPDRADIADQAQFILYVSDQARATAFWAKVLGRSPSLDVPGMTEFTLNPHAVLGLMPETGVKRLLGSALPDPSTARGIPRGELYLVVDDPAERHARAIVAGALELSPLLQRDWGDLAAYSLDPEGHVIAFASRSTTPRQQV